MLEITANKNAGVIYARIDVLKNTSTLVTSPPPGTVYKNLNIWLGTAGFAVPANIQQGIIRFRVRNNWLSNISAGAGDITMLRWDGTAWAPIETKEISSDTTFTYYEAASNTFSPFAVSAKVPVTPRRHRLLQLRLEHRLCRKWRKNE